MSVDNPQQLVLSLFPGIDLLGRAFEQAGFCVVRGPDIITGGDIRDFRAPAGRIDGVVGGPPCQGFSQANQRRRDPCFRSVIYSREMLVEFVRVVEMVQPTWWLCENVPGVPDVKVRSYSVQRLAINDRECGGRQLRNRHIQFGHIDGHIIRPARTVTPCGKPGPVPVPATTKTNSRWHKFADQCRLQGLDKPLRLNGWNRTGKFRAIGNAVSMHVGRTLAEAVKLAGPPAPNDCPCGCGRVLTGKQKAATVTCRKWLQRDRERVRPCVSIRGYCDNPRQRDAAENQ